MFVGWDWASTAHDVTVIDSAGELVHRMAIPHTEDGIARAVAKLADYGDPGELPVAIEATRGLVVDRLLGVGHPVIPVHPNAFHAVRPRWGAARAKNDPGDSFKLADYARTDIHRLPVLVPTLPRNPRAAGVDPPTRLSASVAHRRGQPAGGTAGPVLAGRENHFRPTAFADRVGLPRPLPDTAGRRQSHACPD